MFVRNRLWPDYLLLRSRMFVIVVAVVRVKVETESVAFRVCCCFVILGVVFRIVWPSQDCYESLFATVIGRFSQIPSTVRPNKSR